MKKIAYLFVCFFLISTLQSYSQATYDFVSSDSIAQCAGLIYDAGGATAGAPYVANQNDTLIICPDQANQKIELDFSVFNLAIGDTMCVYDGAGMSSPLIGCYTSTTIDNTTIYSNYGCLTLHVFTDGSTENEGWVIGANCNSCQLILPGAITIPAFDTATHFLDACLGDTIFFEANTSYPENDLSYHQSDSLSDFVWNVNGVNYDTSSFWHAFNFPGYYPIFQQVTDSNGCHRMQEVLVVRISGKPNFAGTVLNISEACTDTIDLFAQATTQYYSYNFSSGGEPLALPDLQGIPFSSTTDINVFLPGQTVTSGADIQSICVNMEHSFMGDIEIQLICPNGQSIMLSNQINQGALGCFLGVPNDGDDIFPIAGTGWDYCWSMGAPNGTWNTFMGTGTYATLPSDTYAPDDSFDDLIGCPLNGTWTFEVTDLWASDNGYIFNWHMGFDPSLIPGNIGFQNTQQSSYWTYGNTVISNSDTAYFLGDTSYYHFTYHFIDDFGCEYDTTLIKISPNYAPDITIFGDTILCSGDSTQLIVFNNSLYPIFRDDFDPINSYNLLVMNGAVDNICGSVNGNALYFNGAARAATTVDLDVSAGGNVEFYLEISQGAAPCENADNGENVFLQYSINGGANWFTINQYDVDAFPNFIHVTENIPLAAQTAATRFRWNQPAFSAAGQDNWSIDEIFINTFYASGITYNWSPVNSTNDSVWSLDATTTYTVVATNPVGGCTDTASFKVTVLPPLSIHVTTTDTSYCLNGNSETFTATPTGGYWTGLAIDSASGVFTPANAGLGPHEVQYHHFNGVCWGTDTFQFFVRPFPAPPLASSSSPYCARYRITDLTAVGSGGEIHWFLDSTLHNPVNPVGVIANNFSLYVTETNTYGCHSFPAVLPIAVSYTPNVSFTSDFDSAKSQAPVTINFENTSAPANAAYSWYINGTKVTNTYDMAYEFKEGDVYPIMLVGTNPTEGCSDTAFMLLDLYQLAINIPNVFTPNGDLLNELFYAKAKGVKNYTLTIYNRWGKIVYGPCGPTNKPIDCAWNGGDHPDGTYFYTMTGEDRNGKAITRADFQGYITLIRK